MKPLKMSILIACMAVLTALLSPTVSSAAEIQINGQKAAIGTELQAEGRTELNTQYFGVRGCSQMNFTAKIAKNEHFDVGPYMDYGFFDIEAPKQYPVNHCTSPVEGGTIKWSNLQLSLNAPITGTTYNSKYIGGPNAKDGAFSTGTVSIKFDETLPSGGVCNWSGSALFRAYGSMLTIYQNGKELTSVGGCGKAQLSAEFNVRAKQGSSLIPVTFR